MESIRRAGSPSSSTVSHDADTAATDSSAALELGSIVYNRKEENNEELANLVHLFHYHPWTVKIEQMLHPDMEPTRVSYPNVLDVLDDYYLGRGYGQVHYSLYYRPDDAQALRYLPDPFPAFSHTPQDLWLYQTQRPYTSLSYSSSIHKDFHVSVSHTQNVMPRWNFALNADFVKREGVYTRDAVKDENFDFSTNYYSRDSRYQLQAGVIRTVYNQEENGGVLDDSTCWLQTTRSGVAVELYEASNKWRSTVAFLHQSYNTVVPFQQLQPIYHPNTDSIAYYDTVMPQEPHILNSGVLGWDVEFAKQKRNYDDGNPSHFSYHFVDTARTHDSTTAYLLASRLYWTNDAYMHARWKNPWVVTLGVMPQVAWLPTLAIADGDTVPLFVRYGAQRQQPYFSVSPFFSSHWTLSGDIRAELEGETMCGSYRQGDYHLHASIRGFVSPRLLASLHARLLARLPYFFYYQYSGNHARWYYDESHYARQRTRQLTLRMQLLRHHASEIPDTDSIVVTTTSVHHLDDSRYWQHETQQPLLAVEFSTSDVNNVILNDGGPTAPFHQYSKPVLLLQASLRANLQWQWLHWDMLHTLQHTSRADLLDVPVFATKNSLYADFPLFNKAMRIQTGINLRYFTSYHADAWKPYYGLFTHQNDVAIGNYLWSDLFLTAQIKQVSFYVKVSHWNSLSFLGSDFRETLNLWGTTAHYFTLPHYPGEDLNVYWGITWKFFN